ncbi:20419_t:CDS:2, partial [Gigaspora rosea]
MTITCRAIPSNYNLMIMKFKCKLFSLMILIQYLFVSNGFKDFGQFLTSIFIVTGVCLPVVLAHASVISVPAMFMSIGGGAL